MNMVWLKNFLKRYDFSFFVGATVIFLVGVINLYSATHSSSSATLSNIYKAQIMWFVISMLIGFVVSFIGPKTFSQLSVSYYVVIVILLLLVLVLGHEGMGARRWLIMGPLRIQPSELAKIAVVFILARWFSKVSPDRSLNLKRLIIPFILTAIPALLTIMEPDLGTGLVMILVFTIMAFFRRLRWKTLIFLVLTALVSGLLMYNFGLKPYQKKRVITFLNPQADARGSGYNAIQSKIAIGSGKLLGKGFKKSTQASLNYLPENHTDFAFSVFNEEHGLVGAFFLITLYIALLFRFIWLSQNCLKFYDSLVTIGIMSIFFWHTIVNMAMVMGLMPIVGLPLPFFSYGGSSILTFGICCGIATSISNSRNIF